MRIGINGLSVTNRSGTGYYTQNLILSLSKIDPENDYFLFLPEECLLDPIQQRRHRGDPEALDFGERLRDSLKKKNRIQPILVSRRNRWGRVAWEQFYLPREVRRLELDLFHSPTGIASSRLPCPSVITLHDVAYRRYPELFPWLQRHYLQRALSTSAKRASGILTDSQFSSGEIQSVLGIENEKIHPVLLGVSDRFSPEAEAKQEEEFQKKYQLPEKYILALGTVEPRKNLLTLIEAYARVAESDSQLDLVLVGRRGWMEEPVFEKIESLGLGNRAKWTGFIPRKDLPGFYRQARVFIYLSLYEGFGLPVLEAMACGTVVVASDIPVFQEWTSGAARLVNAYDPEQIAKTLLHMTNSSQQREEYEQVALSLADQMSWESTAEATLEVYQNVCHQHSSE